MRVFHAHRMLPLLAMLGFLASIVLWANASPAPTQAQSATDGLSAQQITRDGQQYLVIRSPERFELWLDESGIAAWYDLRRDPQRNANLVVSGAHLLEHQTPSGSPPRSAPLLVRLSPARAIVRWQGADYTQEYVIWAGGQVVATTDSHEQVATSLQRDPAAITGATLLPTGASTMADGTIHSTQTLFLDAWTGERATSTQLQPLGSLAGVTFDPQRSVVVATPRNATSVVVRIPDGIGRQPRFEISNWPDGAFTLRRNGVTLVEGADYLADYDPQTRQLVLQYLHLLPPSAKPAERAFELTAAPTAVAVSLSIPGKSLDETGMLVVDGNMPSSEGIDTIADTFKIPYIQSSASLALLATVSDAPAGARVKFILDGTTEQTDTTAPFQANFTLTLGEHTVQALLLNGAGAQIAADSISPLGYGVVLQSIGDSITAGKWGPFITKQGLYDPVETLQPGTVGVFPPTSYVNQRAGTYSRDRRNLFQYDGYWTQQQDSYYYRGYQVDLNDKLSACYTTQSLPIFILNDGFSGLRLVAGSDANRKASSKVAAYNDHIDKLGVQHTLLMLGTNDVNATGSVTPANWRTAINSLIDGLQAPNAGLRIWLAHVPYRADFAAQVEAFNALIPGIVAAQNQPARPVSEGPDFYTWFAQHTNQLTTTSPDPDPSENGKPDALHPTAAGLLSMADLWKQVLCSAMPQPPPRTTATSTATSTATATPTELPVTTPTATQTCCQSKVWLPLLSRGR